MSSENRTLEITAVRVYPFDTRETGGRTVAYAEIEIGGALLLRGLRVLVSEKKGLFLGFPSQGEPSSYTTMRTDQTGSRQRLEYLSQKLLRDFLSL